MNEVYLKTLELLDCSLHGKDDFVMDASLWPEIVKELEAQTVLCLVAKSINKLNLSSEDKLMFMQRIGMSFQYFRAIGEEQKKIFEILDSHSIKSALLKGYAAAMYYPTPEHRAMGDIDLIISETEFNDAITLFVQGGYTLRRSVEEDGKHAVLDSASGIRIEPHIRFSETDSTQGKQLDSYLRDGLLRLENINVCGCNVWVLPQVENGLVLLDHINQHLESGLGLRQIIDWMMYVENCLEDNTWECEFAFKAESIGLKKLAMVTTATCKKYLGLKESITWADEYLNSEIADHFILYIMDRGNFGRKDNNEAKAVKVTRLSRNPIKLLKTAQKYGVARWNAAKRYPVLKIFAWAYQLIRWIRLGFQSGVISEMKRINDKERYETEFLNELGVIKS